MQGAIWFLLLTLNTNSFAKDPVIKDLGEINGVHIMTGFSALSEYRDWISTFVVIVMFAAREYYQFRKDRDRIGVMETNQTEVLGKVSAIEDSQLELSITLKSFIRAYEKSEERLNDRVARIENVMDKR